MQRAIDLGLAAWGRTVDRPQPSEIGKCVWHEQKRSTLTLDGPGSQDAFTRGIALPDAALALASAAELPILIEEAEGVLGRITHDTTCRWCAGQPGAAIPVGSFWCTH
jgi:hypothetical protein